MLNFLFRTLVVAVGVIPAVAAAQFAPLIPRGDLTVRTEIVATGLGGLVGGEFQISPTEIVPDGSGRLFAATLGGVVRTLDASGQLLPTPFMTQAQTNTSPAPNGEWGMTGFAFHPDYLSSGAAGYGKFYTITTEPAGANGGVVDFGNASDHQDVIKEWTATDPLADVFAGSVRELLRVGQPGEPHNVVDLAFDDDAYLYVSSGDGGFGNAGAAQSLGSVFGKVLRIDPLAPAASDPSRGAVSANGAYRVPIDNPFVDVPGALGEVYALGLRSPFRMNFDRQNGDLWIGDVGAVLIEEVSRIEAGGNYGWPFFEGSLQRRSNPPPTAVPPVFEYPHDDGLSVIGGFVYRGSAIPELYGKYVFADLGEGSPSARLFYGDPATGEEFELQIDPFGDTFLAQLGPEAGSELPLPERIISIGEDENGELYLAAVGVDPRQGGGVDGMIVRLLPETLPGDFDRDGDVDDDDFGVFAGAFGGAGPIADFDGDGDVDDDDFGVFAGSFGAGATPAAAPEPSAVAFAAIAATAAAAIRRRGSPRSR